MSVVNIVLHVCVCAARAYLSSVAPQVYDRRTSSYLFNLNDVQVSSAPRERIARGDHMLRSRVAELPSAAARHVHAAAFPAMHGNVATT